MIWICSKVRVFERLDEKVNTPMISFWMNQEFARGEICLLLLLVCLISTVNDSRAQTSRADDVLVSGDGSIFVVGSAEGHTFRNHILGTWFTMKLDSDGVVQWVFEEGNDFDGRSIVQDSDGAIYIISENSQNNAKEQLIKILPDGTIAWHLDLVDAYHASLAISPDDELCVSATFRSEAGGTKRSNIKLYRVSSNGQSRWSRQVEQSELTLQKATTIATTSGCYLGGEMRGNLSFPGAAGPLVISGTEKSAFLSFFNLSGQAEWAKRLSSSLTYPRQIILGSSEDIFMTGVFKYPEVSFGENQGIVLQSDGSFDVFVVKTNLSGDVQWATGIGGTFYDDANSLALDASGELTIFGSWGQSESFGNTSSSLFFSRFDSDGQLTSSSLDGFVSESPRSDWKYSRGEGISFGPDGEMVVVGSLLGTATMGSGSNQETIISGNYDLFVAKYDASDQLVWSYASAYIPPVDTLISLYPRFTNLEEGNLWEFQVSDLAQAGAPGPYIVFDIPEESIADGQLRKILRAREFDTSGALRDESICSIDVLGPGDYAEPDLISCSESGEQCRCTNRMIDLVILDSEYKDFNFHERVQIGPWSYWIDATASYTFSGSGTGGSGGGESWTRGTDIGLLQYGAWSSCHWADQNCQDTSWQANLIHAVVDGQVFGATAVNTEKPEISSLTTDIVSGPFPNPTNGSFSIEIILHSPQSVTLHIFDLLGRELLIVQQGTLPVGRTVLRLDRNNMPSGVHLLRINGEEFESTTKVVFLD